MSGHAYVPRLGPAAEGGRLNLQVRSYKPEPLLDRTKEFFRASRHELVELFDGWKDDTYVDEDVVQELAGHLDRFFFFSGLLTQGGEGGAGGGVMRPLVQVLQILVHEMAHAFLDAFVCRCGHCGPENVKVDKLGPTRHGRVWQQLVEAMTRVIKNWDYEVEDFRVEGRNEYDRVGRR